MRTLWTIILVLIAPLALASDSQLIKIDDDHLQMGTSQSDLGEVYRIPPTQSLIIDASDYQFIYVEERKTRVPNTIMVLTADKKRYFLEWKDGIYKYTLSPETLTDGANTFHGFVSGESTMLAIGSRLVGKKGPEMKIQWLGLVQTE
ncbi:MAG: hypothetical protein CL693_18185 [Cellvibrionaceae bacterium]|nr:hypothetical protein [Cellvibrionaceae bacterium]|tara:strand:- start:36 stop:476 length:441 start_codon:yes stop_codon:yes gene_type:complete